MKILSDGYGNFPPVSNSDADGLLAIGGTLAVDRLLCAYQSGIFPWYNEDDPICWYAPRERFVLFPSDIKVSKSMRPMLHNPAWKVTWNTDFDAVIRHCAAVNRPGQDGTWIHEEMIDAYKELHRLGHAHSLEVWYEGALVGGLYGVGVQHVFCGESMFSLRSNASKLALIHLCRSGKYELIDCQVYTEHLARMGATLIPRDTFMKLLEKK